MPAIVNRQAVRQGAAAEAGVPDRDRAVRSMRRGGEGDRGDRRARRDRADSPARGGVGGWKTGIERRDVGAAGAAGVAAGGLGMLDSYLSSGRDRRALPVHSCRARRAVGKLGSFAGETAGPSGPTAWAVRLRIGRKGRRRGMEASAYFGEGVYPSYPFQVASNEPCLHRRGTPGATTCERGTHQPMRAGVGCSRDRGRTECGSWSIRKRVSDDVRCPKHTRAIGNPFNACAFLPTRGGGREGIAAHRARRCAEWLSAITLPLPSSSVVALP